MTECSAKYKDAKAAGTLNGMTWNDFRKAKCGSDATAAPAGSPSAAAPSAASATAANAAEWRGFQVFKGFSGQGAQRDLPRPVRTNKANNGNGGLKWMQKGGGYYSECTKKLKGAA